jgi:hypothetical protein
LHSFFVLLLTGLLVTSATAVAQNGPVQHPPEVDLAHAPAGHPSKTSDKTADPDKQSLSVSVKVVHAGQDDKAMAGKPVILRAARPKGPFEPTDPQPKHEWTGVTGADGTATFADIPASVADEGLRLHALTTHGSMSFKSSPKVPATGITLNVPVYERGHDVSQVSIDDMQTIVHVWEDNLFIQQFYRLKVTGNQVLDVATLSGKEFESGLPIELPVKAMGIDVKAPGETKVVNSFVYWKGMLKPGETVPVSVSFSMQAKKANFVYEQELDYPVESASVVVPLESRHERVKIPFFKDLELAAPGFDPDNVGTDRGALGSQNSGLFLAAKDRAIAKGERLQFEISGLPFGRPAGAWVALGLGILGALFVFGFARREKKNVEESHASGEIHDLLIEEREALLDELALLEEDYQDGEVSELEYERESLLLRERIALVMKKIRDLEDKAA